MIFKFSTVFPALAGLVIGVAQPSAQTLVLTNAEIYTVDESRSWAEAVAIDQDGVILTVGREADVLAAAGSEAELVDLGGRMVLPGFQDIHLHAVEAGVNMVNLLDLHGNPVEILDRIVPDRPVLILDDIGHGAWINSRALQAAGFDNASDTANGNIILRSDSGAPNGVVLENAPQSLRNLAFPPTEDNLDFAYGSLLNAAAELNANGITSVSDAGGYWPQGHHLVWDRAEEEGTLTLRASNAFYINPDRPWTQQLEALKALRHDDPDRLVRFNVAKIYVDGILSQATGALLTPCQDGLGLGAGEELGYLYFEQEALMQSWLPIPQERIQFVSRHDIAGLENNPTPRSPCHLEVT